MADQVDNQVFVASATPIDRFPLGADGQWVEDVAAFAAAGRVLTDDFAPVDQLITTR